MVELDGNLGPKSAWEMLLSYQFALHSRVPKDLTMGDEIYNSLVSGLADESKLNRLKDLLKPFQTRKGASDAYIVAITSQVQEILDSKEKS